MLKDALAGFRCVDFSWVFAGPYCGQLLGDLGMEMIKIECRKRMDVVRNYPPFAFEDRRLNSSGYWNTHNRSKYSVNLDMKSEKARELVTQLIAMSDLVLENFSARGMKALGFDYERLREIVGSILGLPANHQKTRLCVHSILGQVAHFAHARPMLALLWPEMTMTLAQRQLVTEHIADFSLAYLQAQALTRVPS